jgi:hypothetical protein
MKRPRNSKRFSRFFSADTTVGRIQVLRTDGGGEYANVDLFCQQTGVARQITESSASNGKAEWMHRTILNMARCMIFNSGLPMRFWGDAVKYASYVLNRSPSRSNLNHQSRCSTARPRV